MGRDFLAVLGGIFLTLIIAYAAMNMLSDYDLKVTFVREKLLPAVTEQKTVSRPAAKPKQRPRIKTDNSYWEEWCADRYRVPSNWKRCVNERMSGVY